MFQLALDQDAVLGISGIGPKAMDEIMEKLANLKYPTPEMVEPVAEAGEISEPQVEEAIEVLSPPGEKVEIPELVELPETEGALVEPITPTETVEQPAAGEIPLQPIADKEIPETTDGVVEVDQTEKPIDFNEIFTLPPEALEFHDTEDEEDEEDLDKKGKKKKKKKKFVEVVYDPDRDITLVKRKRKRGGDWEDDWNL
jgi:hypothetical protein